MRRSKFARAIDERATSRTARGRLRGASCSAGVSFARALLIGRPFGLPAIDLEGLYLILRPDSCHDLGGAVPPEILLRESVKRGSRRKPPRSVFYMLDLGSSDLASQGT